MDAYMESYVPRPGDVVWDVGAHAGMTVYFFSRMVGPRGKVIAFEPDEANFEYLMRNVEMHRLTNVIPVRAALSDKTGTATFCMNGTMSSGLVNFLPDYSKANGRLVETLTLQDACDKLAAVPAYIKMDIEGAELGVVAGSLDFLKANPIHLSIESNHVVGGKLTSGPLETLLAGVGYRAWSSDKFGQMFTWAAPVSTRLSEDRRAGFSDSEA